MTSRQVTLIAAWMVLTMPAVGQGPKGDAPANDGLPKLTQAFARAKQLDTKQAYAEFLATYSLNDMERKLAQSRHDDLKTPLVLPDTQKEDAARVFATGAQYYVWRDAADDVVYMGDSNAVMAVLIHAKAIAAPGSGSPLFVQVAGAMVKPGSKKASPVGETGIPAHADPQFATPSHPARILPMYSVLWDGPDRRLSGKGTMIIALLDFGSHKQISNSLAVEVDCADAGKKSSKDSGKAETKKEEEKTGGEATARKAAVVLAFTSPESAAQGAADVAGATRAALIRLLKEENMFSAVLTPEEAEGKDAAGLLEIRGGLWDFKAAFRGRGHASASYEFRITNPITGDLLWNDLVDANATTWSKPAPSGEQLKDLSEAAAKSCVRKLKESGAKDRLF